MAACQLRNKLGPKTDQVRRNTGSHSRSLAEQALALVNIPSNIQVTNLGNEQLRITRWGEDEKSLRDRRMTHKTLSKASMSNFVSAQPFFIRGTL